MLVDMMIVFFVYAIIVYDQLFFFVCAIYNLIQYFHIYVSFVGSLGKRNFVIVD